MRVDIRGDMLAGMSELGMFHFVHIEGVVNCLIESGVAQPTEIRGCTAAEVEELAALWKLPLPSAYRAFLTRLGRGAGRFYVGTDMFYPVVLKLAEWSARYQAEQPSNRLPADAVVFAMHQGYQVLFFLAMEGDDPPVYHHLEGEAAPVLQAQRFSEFLLKACEDEW